jgi:stress-induced morphogen
MGSREVLIDMAIRIPRGGSDAVIESIEKALGVYQKDHPSAEIDIYRQNPVSVRIRVIDPDFAGTSRIARHETIWKCLEQVSDDDQGDISMLVLLTPEETNRSMANLEFDDPVPSIL